jgi:hypothetical protein
MAVLANSVADEQELDVRCNEHSLIIDLMDRRTIAGPRAWYPRLQQARARLRATWDRASAGYGIYWPGIDEDLGTEGLLRGAPAARAA